jgi:preprotein translocase subunit SecD
MTTIREALEKADPLRHEPEWSVEDREKTRRDVIDMAGLAAPRHRRMMSLSAIVALAVVVSAALVGLWPRASTNLVAAIRFEVRLAEERAVPGLSVVTIGSNRTIYLYPETIVENSDITSARVIEGDGETFGVSVTFSAGGAAKMRRATTAHIGRPIAILLDGEVIAAPTVRSAISDAGVLQGRYTRAEAERIATGIIGR